MPVKPILESVGAITPYVTAKGAAKIIECVVPDELRRRAEKHMGESQ